MKKIIVLVISVFLFTSPLAAQNPTADTIPQLKEWWVAPPTIKGLGRYGVSHIPNFYHGKDAMAVSINDGTMVTWLNRFPGDTTNIFSWKGGGPVLQGDFNGDGIIDYFGGGYIYQGITNGEPPDTATLNYSFISPNFVADVNHDGYDDLVWTSRVGGKSIKIFLGAADLHTMQEIYLSKELKLDSTMEIDHSYMGSDGDMRFIAFTYTKTNDQQRHFDGYVLFRAHWNKGDTFPEVTMLTKIIRYENTDIPFSRGGAVYTSKHTSKKFFIAKESVPTTQQNNIIIYDITEDTFKEVSRIYYTSNRAATPHILNKSMDMDSTEDWYFARPNYTIEFHSGGDILDTAIYSKYYDYCYGSGYNIGHDIVEIIGDVNGDGIHDIAFATSSNVVPNCFRIVLGVNKPTGVTEPPLNQENTFMLSGTSPHPLVRGKNAVVSTNIPTNGVYTLELYNSVGKHIAELHRHYYDGGIQRITFDISQFSIATGSYILRLRNGVGEVVGERTIIIE